MLASHQINIYVMHIITFFISYVYDLIFLSGGTEVSDDGEAADTFNMVGYYSSHIFVAVFFPLKVDFEQPLGVFAVMLVELNQAL